HSADPQISTCRHCQHYQLQGRRGGICQKLNVGVQSDWSACALAVPAFSDRPSPSLDPQAAPQISIAAIARSTNLYALDAFDTSNANRLSTDRLSTESSV
ncbi:MAG: hypothetical protein RLZZ511_4052, partial [Cyanobacteriota bacterium]